QQLTCAQPGQAVIARLYGRAGPVQCIEMTTPRDEHALVARMKTNYLAKMASEQIDALAGFRRQVERHASAAAINGRRMTTAIDLGSDERQRFVGGQPVKDLFVLIGHARAVVYEQQDMIGLGDFMLRTAYALELDNIVGALVQSGRVGNAQW